jgi:hypothetical protein
MFCNPYFRGIGGFHHSPQNIKYDYHLLQKWKFQIGPKYGSAFRAIKVQYISLTSLTYLLLPFMWCSLPFLCLQLVFSKSSIFQFLCQEIPVQSIWKKENKTLKHTSCTINIQVQHLASIWLFCSQVIIWNPIRDICMDDTCFNSCLWRSIKNA